MDKIIWTIGHSTRTVEELIEILKSCLIELIVDVRSYPGSRRYPQFNIENLSLSFPQNGIEYIHKKELGGRRKPDMNSKNTDGKMMHLRALPIIWRCLNLKMLLGS
jgi:uncharacterized protein (DUF488 family)